jgi:hypothetical protein
MNQTVDGETKWKIQRRAEYLLFSALHRFEEKIKRSNLSPRQTLSVRSQGISFRNSNEIDIDRPLSNTFIPEEKVKLWRSLGNQGSGNGDVAALSLIKEQIEAEIAVAEQNGKVDNRLRIVIACSDGSPDSPSGVQQLAQEIGRHNAIVVGIGLTETARAVKTIFDTEFSRGDFVENLGALPAVIAKHVVTEATKLFPEKSKKSLSKTLTQIIDKFD